MKRFEVTGKIEKNGRVLLLDEAVKISSESRVKAVILISEEPEPDPDDTPVEEVKASLRRSLQEAKEGKRIPLSQMWEGIDAEERSLDPDDTPVEEVKASLRRSPLQNSKLKT